MKLSLRPLRPSIGAWGIKALKPGLYLPPPSPLAINNLFYVTAFLMENLKVSRQTGLKPENNRFIIIGLGKPSKQLFP